LGRTFYRKALPTATDKFTIITVNHFDPVTPPENGHILMKKLSKGKLFILDEVGHGGGNFDCRTKIIIAFMDNPSGTLDTACFNLYGK
jgi:hypothetical protein